MFRPSGRVPWRVHGARGEEALAERTSCDARAKRSDKVDAIVVAEAIEAGGAEILTCDAGDLTVLANGERTVTIHAL
jgi:hypothetical protein